MSMESEGVRLGSDTVDGSNASRVEVGNDEMCETLVDPLSCQAQKDGDEKKGSESLVSDGDHGIEKSNGFSDMEKETESVNGGLDLGLGIRNVDVETSESEKKAPVGSEEGEKDSDAVHMEVVVEKEVEEPEKVCSDGANLSDVKESDVRIDREELAENRKSDGSGKQGTKVDEMDIDSFVALEPHESKDESDGDDDKGFVTSKVKLSDSDLVWAKVRSHPWWPGQAFDASVATDKAKKYSKKGSHLVTYFGDCTFAWNDDTKIKPFREHFSQMAKQSRLPDFVDAIDFALEEVSRRIEFGLACSCISEEVYEKIKTQNIINPGIREDSSSIHGGDKVSSAVFFEPAKLVGYMRRLACSPSYDATDELQFVSHRARLLAFNRWKGYTDLPEFETLQGSVESAPKISPAEEKSSLSEAKISVPEPKKPEQVYTKRRKTEDQDNSLTKNKKEDQDDSKHDGVFDYEDTTAPKKKKKEKTLAEFIAAVRLSKSNGNISHENSGNKPVSEKKRKVVHSKLPKSTKKIKANQTDTGSPISPKNDGKYNVSTGDKITPKKARASFGIGQSILKVASQMHSSTPTKLIPCGNSTSKITGKNTGSKKEFHEKPKAKALSERKVSPSPNEKLPSPQSESITKTPSGKPNSTVVDQVIKETPSTNLVEDSVVGSGDLKDSAKEQMVLEDKKEEAANIAGESIIKDNATEEKITGSELKVQSGDKNCSDTNSMEDPSAE